MICEATGWRSAREVTSYSRRRSPSREPVSGAGSPWTAMAETMSSTRCSLERQRRYTAVLPTPARRAMPSMDIRA